MKIWLVKLEFEDIALAMLLQCICVGLNSNRSHVYKTTFNSGKLIPVFVDEVLPGDTTRMSVNYFARLATPIKPIMDNIYLDWFFFFVPNRLVWEHCRISASNRKILMTVLIMSFLLLWLTITKIILI